MLQAIARSSGNCANHAFVIAGPGEPSYVSHLKELGIKLGLEKQLIWAGPLYGDLKWAAMCEAQAYILPSHQENFGISVVEALASGTPVLITNKVNIWRDILTDGAGLVETDDVGGITRMLDRWSALPCEQKADMGSRARQCFLNHFDITSTSANLFRLLSRSNINEHRDKFTQ